MFFQTFNTNGPAERKIRDLIFRAYKFDDKPHQLFSGILTLINEYGPGNFSEKEIEEAKRLMEFMYNNIGDMVSNSREKMNPMSEFQMGDQIQVDEVNFRGDAGKITEVDTVNKEARVELEDGEHWFPLDRLKHF